MPVLPAFLTIIDFLFPFSTHRIPPITNPSPENVSLHDCGRDSQTSGRYTTIPFSQRFRANPTIVIFAETLFGTIGAGVRRARSTLVTKLVTLPTTRTFVFSTTRNVYASCSRAAVNDNFLSFSRGFSTGTPPYMVDNYFRVFIDESCSRFRLV